MTTRQKTCAQMPNSVTYGNSGVRNFSFLSAPVAIIILRRRYWLQQMEIQAMAPVKPETASKYV